MAGVVAPMIRTRQAVGAHKAKWRAEYRFSPDEPWRPVCGPGMNRLRFTTQQGAVHAARYHAAKWEDGR